MKNNKTRTPEGKITEKPKGKKPQYKRPAERKAEIDELQLEGRNAVMEALNGKKSINKLFVIKEGEGSIKRIIAMALEERIVVQEVSRDKLNEMSQTNGNHQGVIAIASAHDYVEVSDILERAKASDQPPLIIILDGITDPHNFGAIVRTAEACGAHGIIIPRRRSVGVNATVAKTSAGAIQHVPVARVTNIARVIDDLKKAGLWIAGTAQDGKNMYNVSLTSPLAIVIGSEGDGISRLVNENCDFSVRIPMYGEISSLNASVAASLVMYEAVRQRRFVKP